MGEMKLLPKTDGYTIMESAFVSREFGMKLDNDELRRLNERRQSREWGHCLSLKEVIEVNGP